MSLVDVLAITPSSVENTLDPEFKKFEEFEKNLKEYLEFGDLSLSEQNFFSQIYHLFKKNLTQLHSIKNSLQQNFREPSHTKRSDIVPQISRAMYYELAPSNLGTAKSSTDTIRPSKDGESPLLRSKIHEAKNILAAAQGFVELYLQEGHEQSFLETALQALEDLVLKINQVSLLLDESPQAFSTSEIQTILSHYCKVHGVSFSFDTQNADFSWNIIKSHLDGILEEMFRNYDKYGESGIMKLSVKNGTLQIFMENAKKTVSKVSYSSGQGSEIIKDFVKCNGGSSEVKETPNSYTLKLSFSPLLS